MSADRNVRVVSTPSLRIDRSVRKRPNFGQRSRPGDDLRTIEVGSFAMGSGASSHRIVLRPMLGPRQGLDVTEAVTRAIAQELWNMHGGNDVMNWLEAERLLNEFLGSWARSAPPGR